MKSRFVSNPQDPFDSHLDMDGAEVFTNFFPVGNGNGGLFAYLPPPTPTVPPTPTLTAESVEAQAAVSGSGGVGSVVAETSGNGITFNLMFDAAAMTAPQSFRNGIEQAASILSATITNKITVNINIDYSGTGGGAAAGPDNGLFESYSTVKADLISNAAPGDTTFKNGLPTGSTIQGQSQVAVWNAQLKLWGLLGANDTTTDDGSATFATDIQSSLLVGVALHELTHALGRVPYGPPYGPQPDIFDLFRFTSPGTQLINGASTAPAAYFSIDGGNTKIADYGQTSDPSDFLNSGVQGGNDPFNEFYTFSTLQSLTAADKEQLDALGFNTIPQGIAVPATASEAIQGGARVALLGAPPIISDPASATLSSATIKVANAGGSAVTGDQLYINGVQNGSVGSGVTASWNAITDTLTLTGSTTLAVYDTLLSEVSFQDTGTDASSGSHPVRTVTWTVNDGTNTYNTTSQITIDRLPVANNGVATNAVGSTTTTTATSGLLSNDTDLDGDKLTVTGISDAVHSAGSVGTSFAGVYGHLTLSASGSYSYVADNLSAINSAPTDSHLQDAFTYTISDGNGGTAAATLTITLDRLPVVTAANVALAAGQTSVAATSLFTASDPDGNTITTYGFQDTSNGHFVLNGVVQANNQEIDVTAAQLSQLTYQSVPGASADTLEVRVNDGTLWSNWTNFTVTPPPLVIQTDGTTSLVEIGNNYFLNTVGSGVAGPELKYQGSPVVAGEFGNWTLIGAVQVSGGYDIAWKFPTGVYSVSSVDSNGNYLTDFISGVAGNNIALEQIETTFHQDLNGDGVIGLYAAPGTTLQINSPLAGTSGSATIGTSATLELAAADSASVTFSSSTGMLKLDNPSTFSGLIFNFAGNGSLSGSDQIDLKGVNFNSVHDSYANGVLTVTDGTNTAALDFNGSYTLANFKFASDSGGGTIIYDPPVSSQSSPEGGAASNTAGQVTVTSNLFVTAGHDSFVFGPNFGQAAIADFNPITDTIHFSNAVFTKLDAVLAATHDDGHGNAVIVDAAHDTITIQHVTTAQLLAHQGDFHFVI